MNIQERLQLLINELNKNENSFAKAIGVASSVIYNIVGGRLNNPSVEVVEKILRAFPKVNPTWLILGDGSIFLEQDVSVKTSIISGEGDYRQTLLQLVTEQLMEANKEIEDIKDENKKLMAENKKLKDAINEYKSGNDVVRENIQKLKKKLP
jgi:transcriptional regulator with XRE-family HTH domain